MAKEYMNRICDQVLQDKLEAKGAVLIKGAKWCGKTTTAEHVARSVIYMEDPSKKQQYLQMADINPSQLLKGEVPHLIDEWQLAPKLWDAVRFEIDQRDDFGQFILTGSAVPPESTQISHTGTGRIASLTMRTMSLFESERARKVLKAYARSVASEASLTSILKDVKTDEADTFSENTLRSYLTALRQIFVIEDTNAWNPNLRSKTAIRSSDTRYFVDPSVATAALGIGPNDLINDLSTAGLIFENLCVRDLRIYADSLDGKVYHYRDKNGLECDAVMHLRNGRYGLIEIKLGGDELIEEGAKNLLALRDSIDDKKMSEPAFMMALCGVAPFAYKRSDGVFVVPIGCLRN